MFNQWHGCHTNFIAMGIIEIIKEKSIIETLAIKASNINIVFDYSKQYRLPCSNSLIIPKKIKVKVKF